MSFITHKSRHAALLAMTVLLVMCLFATGAAAADRETLYNAEYCFSAEDFTQDDAQLTGIFVTDVPSATVGTVRYGSRIIHAGDALPADALAELVLVPSCRTNQEASLCYLPVTADGVGQVQQLSVRISSGKNSAPSASDSSMETYKNVANTGKLDATDPDNDALQFNLTSAPNRGEVELHDDGTYTYTPAKNKVGKDSFTFTVTDTAGNVSNEATVQIEILKPTDKLTYSDMTGDSDQFVALWLRENGIFSGETVAGMTCFCPDKTVSRGEFLVMVSKLIGLKPDEAQMTSGFADEEDTPQWMRPYIVSAMRAGLVSGAHTEDGLVFRPEEDLTNAEAAVMLQNILQLPATQTAGAFDEDTTVPAWAQESVLALSEAGMPVNADDSSAPITRREAARLLYAVSCLQDAEDN